MEPKQKKGISKFLSYVLRHQPGSIGLELDDSGWADVDDLISRSSARNIVFTRDELIDIVDTNDKKRFVLSEDHSRIRASQGHSVEVELNLPVQEPPEFLFHGTIDNTLTTIRSEGLQKMSRHHVHLSADTATAQKVGSRRGKPVVLRIRSGEMHQKGFVFYISENGVWLTEQVPVHYIDFNLQ